MFKNYVKIALRNVIRHKGYSFINIFGLAVGLTVCILILLWVQDEYTRDGYHDNLDNIYRVNIRYEQSGQMLNHRATPPALGPALSEEYPEIDNYGRRHFSKAGILIKYKDQISKEKLAFMDPSMFEICTFPFISGNYETSFKKPNSVVITEETAERYFGNKNPIGEVLTVNNLYDLTVTGVIQNIPNNSLFNFDFITQFATLTEKEGENFLDDWNTFGYQTYVLLKNPESAKDINEKIYNYLAEHDKDKDIFLYLQPFKDIHLYGLNGNGTITHIYIFSTIAIFILLIACINFMNLSTARSIKRAKEIGLRKVVGAQRLHIRIQFLGESILFSLMALLLAVALSELLLPVFNQLAGKQLALSPLENGLFLILAGLALITGLISGIYPAMFLSSFSPAKVLKGIGKTGSPLFRKVMVTSQFSLSIILIICTIMVSNQLDYMRNKNLGFNKDNIVLIPLNNSLAEQYEPFKNNLQNNPNIISVTATSNKFGTEMGGSTDIYEWEGNHDRKKMSMFIASVDYDFENTFGIEILQGRTFSNEFISDSAAIILNETAIKTMGLEDPIGKKGPFDATIIGVMKDINYHPLNLKIEPLGLFMESGWHETVAIRIRSENIPATLASIEKEYNNFVSAFPYEFSFLDDEFENLYRSEQRLGIISKYFSGLAIIISCLGLFGLATYSAELRTKEIGIRKVLGATIPNIINLLSREFMILVGIANLIAWPVAYYAVDMWLQDFAYRVGMDWLVFILAGFGTFLIAFLTILFKATGAAKSNPVKALRYE
ncbi:MAG: FtsX-like permease family protein [candidate division Zixibacteria bacterium]|nr:FtsX-like permease family protein [candidate division Zixibacteria bacterium]